MNIDSKSQLEVKLLGIDTHTESVIFISKHCYVCRSEGFEVHARVRVSLKEKSILATLNFIDHPVLKHNQAILSKHAAKLLKAHDGDYVSLYHPHPLQSLSYVRAKIYGHKLLPQQLQSIIDDITRDNYSDIYISSFLTACAGHRLDNDEIYYLTRAMIKAGKTLNWQRPLVVDKHCVGGLPGNRTTPIVVSIIAAYGLFVPKTSSRAITSPAGTADVMETLTNVQLSLPQIQKIVETENGCLAWGGAVALSPADDLLIKVSRALDVDSKGQLIASVLSKKIAAGSNHILIDIPVGPTAKIRTTEAANDLKQSFLATANRLGIKLKIIISDGTQPVGRGIGPALEAQDVLEVLQNQSSSPKDLRKKALEIAGEILEFDNNVKPGSGYKIAEKILADGSAWKKFQKICKAQGNLKSPPTANFIYPIKTQHQGQVNGIDNRQLSKLAKLAGAPTDQAAGIKIYTPLGTIVEKGDVLFEIHATSKGELDYAKNYLSQAAQVIQIEKFE